MKLSIIVPNISEYEELDYVINTLKNQNNQDFEVILAVNKPNKKMYSLLESAVNFFGSRGKLIINRKRKNIQSDIVCGLHLVKNHYVYVLNPDAEIRKNFVTTVVNKLEDEQPDILEFAPQLTGSIKWKPNPRLKIDYLYKISEQPDPVAYSFPFIFNKIFKKSFVEQFIKYKVKEINDTKFGTEFLYHTLVNAQTYVYWNKHLVKENISSATWFNPSNFVSQFKIVLNYIQARDIKLKHELTYAMLYFLQIVLAGFLNTWEFSVFKVLNYIFESRSNFSEKRAEKFLLDLYTYLSKYHEENPQFFLTNLYITRPTREAEYLRTLPSRDKMLPWYKNL
ncbi:glycosyltransferase [Mycoplasma simbae]|uniref:glycosyltransferase n=1 Tax=Mycoplasma simbae TaxID=36744 RepID=UPI000497843C|nr:glycosyltransferase family 2 protein [Mycoplasma simbae]